MRISQNGYRLESAEVTATPPGKQGVSRSLEARKERHTISVVKIWPLKPGGGGNVRQTSRASTIRDRGARRSVEVHNGDDFVLAFGFICRLHNSVG